MMAVKDPSAGRYISPPPGVQSCENNFVLPTVAVVMTLRKLAPCLWSHENLGKVFSRSSLSFQVVTTSGEPDRLQ